MSPEITIDGRETGIIDPKTNLGITLSASYQEEDYDLFKVTISAANEESGLEDCLALSCPNTKDQPEVVDTALSIRPDIGLVLHFRQEDRESDGIILMTELGKGKYAAFGISGYQGDKQRPKIEGGSEDVGVSNPAEEAITSIPRYL